MEAYNYSFAACQLGFVQLTPLPPIFTGNVHWHERATVNMDEINDLNSKDEVQTESFKLKLFWRWSESSKPFEEWWEFTCPISTPLKHSRLVGYLAQVFKDHFRYIFFDVIRNNIPLTGIELHLRIPHNGSFHRC